MTDRESQEIGKESVGRTGGTGSRDTVNVSLSFRPSQSVCMPEKTSSLHCNSEAGPLSLLTTSKQSLLPWAVTIYLFTPLIESRVERKAQGDWEEDVRQKVKKRRRTRQMCLLNMTHSHEKNVREVMVSLGSFFSSSSLCLFYAQTLRCRKEWRRKEISSKRVENQSGSKFILEERSDMTIISWRRQQPWQDLFLLLPSNWESPTHMKSI